MKNVLFGILTLGILIGIAAIVVSPELTNLFVGEKKLTQVEGAMPEKSPIVNPDAILKQTGSDWENLSYKDRLGFVLALVKGLESRDMEAVDPKEVLIQIDTYFENNPKEETIEKALLTILSENWMGD